MNDDSAYPASYGEAARPYGTPDLRPGLLVIADGMAGIDFGRVADAAALRLLDVVAIDRAAERLDRQVGCDCVLLFCGAPVPALERLLVQVETIAVQSHVALIVVAPIDSLDLAYASIRGDATLLLCAPDTADMTGALLAATRRREGPVTVHDIGGESDGVRLQQLSEEVGRIARTLEALTRHQAGVPSAYPAARMADRSNDYAGMPPLAPIGVPAHIPADPMAGVTAAQVRDLLRARRMRADLLPGDLFADPAWDMLLDLLAARLDDERVSVSSLCIASAVPPTTALRWIRTLTDRGLVVRQADPHDGRRVFIALGDEAMAALFRWFAASRRYLCGHSTLDARDDPPR